MVFMFLNVKEIYGFGNENWNWIVFVKFQKWQQIRKWDKGEMLNRNKQAVDTSSLFSNLYS